MFDRIKVLIITPKSDFDPSEAAIPYNILIESGQVDVTFATPDGLPSSCDPLMLKGPFYGLLGATKEAKELYAKMIEGADFQNPISYEDIDFDTFDGALFPGGHAKGMIEYLGSELLQKKIGDFFPTIEEKRKVVAAVCHGPLLVARSVDPNTGLSVLAERKTTSLPYYMEHLAYLLTFWKLGTYYRTYPLYVQEEISMLIEKGNYIRGPINTCPHPIRGQEFHVKDGNYISARWPGDAYILGEVFLKTLIEMKESRESEKWDIV